MRAVRDNHGVPHLSESDAQTLLIVLGEDHKKYSKEQLSLFIRGVLKELQHLTSNSTDLNIAGYITLDHLEKDPRYYSRRDSQLNKISWYLGMNW